jgi:hypothetical protein
LRRSWTRWWRTRRLKRQVRRLRRLTHKQEAAVALQQEFQILLELVQNPPQLVKVTPPDLPLPEIPMLTPEEIAELESLPMPDPVLELEHRLGLST